MDADKDGFVDDTVDPAGLPLPFAALHPVARSPGRMWDSHNALPWYQSMNAWALLEAYVAFRDRYNALGDAADRAMAERVRPYAFAALDNLAQEVLTVGLPVGGEGITSWPFSLLLALWKIEAVEGAGSHPTWREAAWGIWNSGVFSILGSRGVNIPLYLLVVGEKPYQPLASRKAS